MGGKRIHGELYLRALPRKLLRHARAVLIEGFLLDGPGIREQTGGFYTSAAGTPITAMGPLGPERAVHTAAHIHHWLEQRGPTEGDGSWQLVLNQEMNVHPWHDGHFALGVVLREVYGLEDDHHLGLSPATLAARRADARRQLDEVETELADLLATLEVTRPKSGLFLCCSGPLSQGRLVIGRFRANGSDQDDDVWFRISGSSQPGLWVSSRGASQDHAIGGAFGFELASTEFGDAPAAITDKVLTAADEKLAAHSIEGAEYFVFPDYD